MGKGTSRRDTMNASILNKSITQDMQKDYVKLERRNTRYRINATASGDIDSHIRSSNDTGKDPENAANETLRKEINGNASVSEVVSNNQTDPLIKSRKSKKTKRSNSAEQKGKRADKEEKKRVSKKPLSNNKQNRRS